MTEQSISDREDLLTPADDDPLAELARIISEDKTESESQFAESRKARPQPTESEAVEPLGVQELGVDDEQVDWSGLNRSGVSKAHNELAGGKGEGEYFDVQHDVIGHRDDSLEDQLIAELGSEPQMDAGEYDQNTAFRSQATPYQIHEKTSRDVAANEMTSPQMADNHHLEVENAAMLDGVDLDPDADFIERIENAAVTIKAEQSDQQVSDVRGEELALQARADEAALGVVASKADVKVDNSAMESEFEDQFARELDLQMDPVVDEPAAFEKTSSNNQSNAALSSTAKVTDGDLEDHFQKEFGDLLKQEDDSQILVDRGGKGSSDYGEISVQNDGVDNFDEAAELEAALMREQNEASVSKRMPGGFRLAASALVLALVAGVGIVAWGNMNKENAGEGGEVPLIKAENKPAKVKPEEPGGTVIANQNNQVYNKVAGDQAKLKDQDALISTRQEPVVMANKGNSRLSPNAESDRPRSNLGLAPKMVRTLVVKPDGTILASAPKPDAATQIANATDLPDSSKAANEIKPALLKGTNSAIEGTKLAAARIQDTVKSEAIGLDGAKTSGLLPFPKSSPIRHTAKRVTPQSRVQAAHSTTTSSIPKPAPTPAQNNDRNAPTQIANLSSNTNKPAVSSSKWKVQVSSQRSRAAAEASFNNIRSRFSSILGNRTASIERADIDRKGTFYRVKVLSQSKNDASQLCTRLKNAGGSCLVTR